MGHLLSLSFLSKSATETALNVAEWVIFVSSVVLAFGALGEYLEEHDKLPRWMDWPKLVFIILVVASLIGEVFGDAGVFVSSERLQSINDAESNALQMRVKNEVDARLNLEEQVLEQGPRNLILSGKRAEAFVSALRQFRGQKVEIRKCSFNDKEESDTAGRLVAIFKLAEWNVSPHSPEWGESNCLIDDPTASGIWIGAPNRRPEPATQETIEKLLGYFETVRLTATLHPVRIETARAENRMSILEEYGDPDSIVIVILGHP